MDPAALTKKFPLISLVVVLLLGSFLRLYKIPEYMTFLGDEGRDAIVMRDIILGHNYPLIGPGTSVGNMYLGPFYYYLVAPSLLISHFSPVGPAVFIALIGIMTIILLWWVSRRWGIGPYTSVMIAGSYAVSPVVITYSRSSWNPNIMPLFALLCIYGIWRVWRGQNWGWLIITALSFAFVLNSHYLGLLLAPTLFIFWLITKNKSLKISIFSFLLLLFFLSPLIIFDASHNWANFNSLKQFLTDRQQTINFKAYKAFPNLWPIWVDINSNLLTAGNQSLAMVVSAVLVLFSIYSLTQRQKNNEIFLVLTWIGIGLIGLGLYKQHIYAHYYGFLFPAPFLLFGLLIKSTNQPLKVLLSLVAILIFILNLVNHPFRHEPNRQLARTKAVAEFITSQAAGNHFNLALVSNHNYDASYRYFLQLMDAGYFPIQDKKTNQLFVICEDTSCQPINHPRYEIAAFGWAKVEKQWDFPWQIIVYKLIPNPSGT